MATQSKVTLSSRPFVAVLWNDAHALSVVEYTEDEIKAASAYQYTTYGLLAREDEEIVAVASEEGEDGKLRGVTFIPLAMVVEIVRLAPRKARVPRAPTV